MFNAKLLCCYFFFFFGFDLFLRLMSIWRSYNIPTVYYFGRLRALDWSKCIYGMCFFRRRYICILFYQCVVQCHSYTPVYWHIIRCILPTYAASSLVNRHMLLLFCDLQLYLSLLQQLVYLFSIFSHIHYILLFLELACKFYPHYNGTCAIFFSL